MRLSVQPVLERGRQYAFPVVWTALLATGVGLQRPLPSLDASLLLSFNVVAPARGYYPASNTSWKASSLFSSM